MEGATEVGLTALIAAIPALVCLLPLSLWMVRARGRQAGAVINDPAALATATRIDTVVLDRWGTVTTGELRVTSVEPFAPDDDRNLRWFAGALQHAADDPVGRAVARLSTRGRLSQVEHHAGHGLSGSVDRHPVRMGRPDWLGMEHRDGIGVTLGVQVDARPIGYVTVGDDIRPGARAGIDRLREDGMEPVLVSDDTSRNTQHLAESCGIEQWHPETAPEKRGRLVAEHQERGRVVAVAGGRPDNAEALDAADLALTDAPDAACAISLSDLDVARIVTALTLARTAARRRSWARRVGAALAAAGVVLALVGVLGPLLAAAYAAVGSLVVAVVATRP